MRKANMLAAVVSVLVLAMPSLTQQSTTFTYRVQLTADPEMLIFHVSEPLNVDFTGITDQAQITELSQKQQKMMGTVSRVRGVDSYGFSRYQASIRKGVAFEWSEVQPAVVAALQAMLAPGAEVKELSQVAAPQAQQQPCLNLFIPDQPVPQQQQKQKEKQKGNSTL